MAPIPDPSFVAAMKIESCVEEEDARGLALPTASSYLDRLWEAAMFKERSSVVVPRT